MTRPLTFLFISISASCNISITPDPPFQQFEFYYNNTWTSAFSLKLTASDTVYIRQHFASNHYQKINTSITSNASYFGILSPMEKMKLDSFIRHLNFSEYDSSY